MVRNVDMIKILFIGAIFIDKIYTFLILAYEEN